MFVVKERKFNRMYNNILQMVWKEIISFNLFGSLMKSSTWKKKNWNNSLCFVFLSGFAQFVQLPWISTPK